MTQVLKFNHPELRVQFPQPPSDQELMQIFADHSDLVIEQEPDGTLVFMSPITNLSGDAEAEFIAQLKIYQYQHGGRAYSSSVGFRLPDGALRSPDAAYILPEKVARFTPEDLQNFITEIPDFVVEVRSKSDRLKKVREKMTKVWLKNGVRLAWLVDLKNKSVSVYRPGQAVETHTGFERELTGEQVLPGFVFDFRLLIR